MRCGLVLSVAMTAVVLGCGEVPVQDTANDADPTDAPTFDPTPDTSVETFEDVVQEHVVGEYDYELQPPAGGPHNEVWQNCGFYDQPIGTEHAVHSQEHGAVWITYVSDLPADQIEVLRTISGSNGYVLVSPYDPMPSPVVASAWGAQVKLPNATDPALQQFLTDYVQGPRTPEPGAPCIGGIGSPSAGLV